MPLPDLQVAHAAPRTAPRLPPGGWLTLSLMLTCLAVRLVHLREMPVFCDEAIYLRWTQTIRAAPAQHLLVSLNDAKFPLHYWLLATVQGGVEGVFGAVDPVWLGRLVSVLLGVATIPALLAFCGQAARWAGQEADHGRLWGWLTGVLLITSPFMALYQRMALAEALVVLEAVVVGWLALRLAHGLTETRRGGWWRHGGALGVTLGLAFITKQGFSYVMALLPITAALAVVVRERERRGWILRRGAAWGAVTAVIVLTLWGPMLLLPAKATLASRLVFKPEAAPPGRWLATVGQNLRAIFLPLVPDGSLVWHPGTWERPLTSGWLWVYLTPPVLLAGTLGLVALGWRKRWRLLAFLGAWAGAMTVAVAVAGPVVYSRYLLLGTVPLLLATAWGLAELLQAVGGWHQGAWVKGLGFAAAGALVVSVLGWGAADVWQQAWHWDTQRLLLADRQQYITGWTAGAATEGVIAWAKEEAAGGRRIVLIAAGPPGVPADALWLALQGIPGVRVLGLEGLENQPILRPGPHGGYLLCRDRWLRDEPEELPLAPGERVYCVTPDPLYLATGFVYAIPTVARFNPQARLILAIPNPPEQPAQSTDGTDGVVVFRVK